MDISKIYEIVSWTLLGIGIIFVLWYTFGKSPTFEQSLILVLVPYIIKLHHAIGAHGADIKHIKESLQKISEGLQSTKSK